MPGVSMGAVAAAPGGLVYSGAGSPPAGGTPAPVAVYRTLDDGLTWEGARAGLAAVNGLNAPVNAIAADPRTPGRILAGTGGRGVYAMTAAGSEICSPDAMTLCGDDGRFRLRVAWKVPPTDAGGEGQAIPLTAEAGAFWFFTPNNVELIVKVVDGRAVNGKFWFFSAALSDVEYTITVTDLQTGETRTYFNSFGELISRSDTAAF